MTVDDKAKPSALRRIVDYVLSQWFIAGLGLAVGLAAAFPKVGMTGGSIRAEWTVKYGCIALIFLITGLSLSTEALIKQAKNYRLHLVTQLISFVGFSAVVYGIVAIIRASHTSKIDPVALAGIILMSILPTTVASNIAMTRNAGGNVEAATIEVCIGNTLGTFITPLLLSMYLQVRDGWGFIQPRASSGNGLTAIYKHMGIQLSITLFAPLIVGQIVQNLWKAQTKKYREMLRLNIVGQVLLLIVIWSTFCNKFATHAFEAITHQSVILTCFLGVGLYAFFTAVCLFVARLPFLGEEEEGEAGWKRVLRKMRFDKQETAAICFCAAAKGLVLGAPLVSILYGGYDERTQAIMSTPIALYQTTQVLLAQLSVKIFKHWIESSPPRGDVESAPQDTETGDDRSSSSPEEAPVTEKKESRSEA
ncbi:hypothetical protein FRC04_006979 [Tulasnella sp. 424]|nr:hypothetical protein FRC04_006979 [Tulasnella sp. 424]KAG8966057.1 hypothetical protein FRC05_002898 [Tulasnella sp. 425]